MDRLAEYHDAVRAALAKAGTPPSPEQIVKRAGVFYSPLLVMASRKPPVKEAEPLPQCVSGLIPFRGGCVTQEEGRAILAAEAEE